jgi:AraC family transcriptional regulator
MVVSMETGSAHIVREIIGWIEDHLEDDLSLEVIAARAGYSPYYFSRMFHAHTRRTVMDHVRGRRLVGGARRLLAEPGLRLVDLALDCGFESQEAFTRAFKRLFGTTPARFRGGFAVEPMEGQYPMTATLPTATAIRRLPDLVTRDRFILAGPARRFDETDKDEIPQLWSRLMGALPIRGQIGGWTTYGLVSGIDRDERTLRYMAGVEVSEDAVLPDGFEAQVIEPATYVVFRLTFDGGPVHLQIADGIRQVWGHLMPESGLKPTGAPDFECYNDHRPPSEPGATMDYFVPVEV